MLRRSALLALALLQAHPARAHGLHGGEGRVTVLPDRVVVTGEEALLDHLVLRDGSGRPLPPDGTLDRPLRWLVLQIDPGEAGGPAARLALEVTAPAGRRVVVLTTGGNVGLVRVEPGPAPRCGDLALSEEGLQEIRGRLESGRSPRLEVDLPLGILETFQPVARTDPDVLTVAEQQAAVPAVRDLVRERLGLDRAEVRFIGPDGEEGTLGAWTARARVRLGLQTDRVLRWDLFNARVLRARLAIVEGTRCREREVTPDRSEVDWTR